MVHPNLFLALLQSVWFMSRAMTLARPIWASFHDRRLRNRRTQPTTTTVSPETSFVAAEWHVAAYSQKVSHNGHLFVGQCLRSNNISSRTVICFLAYHVCVYARTWIWVAGIGLPVPTGTQWHSLGRA